MEFNQYGIWSNAVCDNGSYSCQIFYKINVDACFNVFFVCIMPWQYSFTLRTKTAILKAYLFFIITIFTQINLSR